MTHPPWHSISSTPKLEGPELRHFMEEFLRNKELSDSGTPRLAIEQKGQQGKETLCHRNSEE